jgi:hypothetical protein
MKDRSKRPFCFLLVLGCASLCGVSAAQSTKTDVASDTQKTALQAREAQELRLQIQQLRRSFEQQMDVLEHRLDLLQSRDTANRPQTTDRLTI